MYTLRVRDHFDAAHYLPWHEGKCKDLHGHRWEVEVELQSETLDENGIVIDFGVVKDILDGILPDHQCFNDMGMENPTAEVLSIALYEEFEREWVNMQYYKYVRDDVHLLELTVWESPDCGVTYRRPEG